MGQPAMREADGGFTDRGAGEMAERGSDGCRTSASAVSTAIKGYGNEGAGD